MKSRLIHFAVLLALGISAARLQAATIVLDADDLLGRIVPATPANVGNATEQVDFLVTKYNLGLAHGTNLGNNPADPQNETYWLYRPSAAPSLLPDPLTGTKVDTSNPLVNLGGFTYQYVLFFQANSAWVYYIGNIAGTNSIKWGGDPLSPSSNTNGSTISHYVLFNPSTVTVPDGTTTAVLMTIGLGLVLMVALRRKPGIN